MLLGTLAFCCALEHLLPWIFRGRLKAPVLLREYFGRAIAAMLAASDWHTDTAGTRQRAATAQPFRGSARSHPGDFTSPVTDFALTLSLARCCLLPFSTFLHTPRQHHELARVRLSIVVIGSNSEFHLRFKKSMNRAGTTVRMEPLVFPSADNSPFPCLHFRSSSKRQVK